MKRRIFLLISVLLFCFVPLNAQPADLQFFIRGYPEVDFQTEYDFAVGEWKITITSLGKETELYWCDGRMLPKSEIQNKDKYRTNLWPYPDELKDPDDMTEEEITAMRNYGTRESRKNSTITPPFFYDAVYDTKTEGSAEKHMVRMTFLGQRTRVHETIKPILETIEEELREMAETDEEIGPWIESLNEVSSYYWRSIRDTGGKSFHSYGIAVDILPARRNDKALYWLWVKDWRPDTWMLLPLKYRWIPPKKVLDCFERHGFIWGGKWVVYDNMHFEYHPEIFEYKKGLLP